MITHPFDYASLRELALISAPQKPQLTQPLIAAQANVTPSPFVTRQRKETDNHDNDPNRDAC